MGEAKLAFTTGALPHGMDGNVGLMEERRVKHPQGHALPTSTSARGRQCVVVNHHVVHIYICDTLSYLKDSVEYIIT